MCDSYRSVDPVQFSSVQLLSHVRLFETLCTPGLPIHHQLPEFTQTHVHWVGDAIQPSYPLSSPSPLAFNLPQDQGLFKWVTLHQVAKVLEFQLQNQTFQWIFRTDGQGGLACCGSWGRKELDKTEQLNWTELNWTLTYLNFESKVCLL